MHPGSGAAFNNLAHVLAALCGLADAEAAARTAVALGGPTLSEARKTLDAIPALRASSHQAALISSRRRFAASRTACFRSA